MKNTKILATMVAIPFIGILSYASADFDCTTLDRESVKSIMDKQRSGETLSSEEQTLLENVKVCKPSEWSWSTMGDRKMRFGSGETIPGRSGSGMMMRDGKNKIGSGQTLTDEQKAQMEQVHTIITKTQNGETLSAEEQAIFDAHQAKMNSQQDNTQTKTTKIQIKLSNSYKNAINKKIQNLLDDEDSTSEKIEALESFATKINTLNTKLSSTEMTQTKKVTFQNIINYILQSIDEEINSLNTSNETDDILDGLLN